MNPQRIKAYAIAAGAVVAAYALYRLVNGVNSFFGDKQNPVLGTRAVLGKERTKNLTATEVLLLEGKITVTEAERRMYPERFQNKPKVALVPVPTSVNTDRHGVVKPPCLFCT